jgi:hypothetical protein
MPLSKRLSSLAFLLSGFILCAAAAPVAAQTAREPWTITLMLENDSLLLIDDKHYTNGLYASATSGGRPDCGFCASIARATMLAPSDDTPGDDAPDYRYGFFLGQSMFTPERLSRRIPDPNDRPYAGWLFAGGRVYRESGPMLDKVEVSVGLVGPGSGADSVQRWWHALHWFGGATPRGWHAQLKDEPTLELTEQRIWRKTVFDGPIKAELLPEAKVTLGNALTYAGAGVTFRFGQNLLADWGLPRIAPAIEGSDFINFKALGDFAWYFFAGIEGRAVARNIFLDGNALQHSASVDKMPLVADFNLGAAAILFKRIRASVSYTERTREFRTQQGNDNFMSVALSYSY